MTGVEFLELAMKNYPDIKRALLTVYADTNATIKSINKARIDFYLMEPWGYTRRKYVFATSLMRIINILRSYLMAEGIIIGFLTC